MKADTTFKVFAQGDIPAAGAASVVARLNEAYGGLWMLEALARPPGGLSAFPRIRRDSLQETAKELAISLSGTVLNSEVSTAQHSLKLKGVVLQSPGFWEFIGSLNPATALLQYLNDRHERLKDIGYRNRLEREHLDLENHALRLKLVREVISVLREANVPPDQIATIVRDHAQIPLLRLETLQDKGAISRVEIAETSPTSRTESADA